MCSALRKCGIYAANTKVENEAASAPATSNIWPRTAATRISFTFTHLKSLLFCLIEETRLSKSLVGWLNMNYFLSLVITCRKLRREKNNDWDKR